MKKSKNRLFQVILLAYSLSGIIGCSVQTVPIDTSATLEESTWETEEIASETGAAESSETDTEPGLAAAFLEWAAGIRLKNTVEAIEKQYPDQTFSDIPSTEVERLTLSFKDSYRFAGRESSEGWAYLVGSSKIEGNPLVGMTCGTGTGVTDFSTSQFDNGKLLLMENSDSETSDLSYLYDVLQQGERGIAYLMEAGERGVSLVPPKEGPFMKVSMVKQGVPVTEFIPLTETLSAELLSGDQVAETEENWTGRIAVCRSRGELKEVWNGALTPPTKQMAALAEEKSGFLRGSISDLGNFVKAEMQVSSHGELREETIENRDDLARLTELLAGAAYEEPQIAGNYGGVITLTKQDGTVMTVQLAAEGGGYILGNSVSCGLSEDDTKEIWSVFSKIESFRQFGDKIKIKMTKPSFTADSEELTFTLLNDTGKRIEYILSPVIYKKEKDSWKRIESIAGFCGVLSTMDGESLDLSVPFKDAFETEGAGIYKIEVQAMPEPDMRFEIFDSFELKAS